MRIIDWRSRWHRRHPVYGPITRREWEIAQMIKATVALMPPNGVMRGLVSRPIELRQGMTINIPRINAVSTGA